MCSAIISNYHALSSFVLGTGQANPKQRSAPHIQINQNELKTVILNQNEIKGKQVSFQLVNNTLSIEFWPYNVVAFYINRSRYLLFYIKTAEDHEDVNTNQLK